MFLFSTINSDMLEDWQRILDTVREDGIHYGGNKVVGPRMDSIGPNLVPQAGSPLPESTSALALLGVVISLLNATNKRVNENQVILNANVTKTNAIEPVLVAQGQVQP